MANNNGKDKARSVELQGAALRRIATTPKQAGRTGSAYADITVRVPLNRQYRQASDFLMTLQEGNYPVELRITNPELDLVEA